MSLCAVPAVGQRWERKDGQCSYDVLAIRDGRVSLKVTTPPFHVYSTIDEEWFLSARYLGPTPSPAQPEQPPTPVAASSPVTGVGGRDACKPWCGLPYLNDLVPGDACSFAFDEDPDQPGWCSPLCRDERRPPMGERISIDDFRAEVDQAMAKVAGDLAAQDWGAEPKPVATDPALIAKIQRIRAHAIAEGGDSATRADPGRTRDTFADLADDWDCLPDAGPVGQRR